MPAVNIVFIGASYLFNHRVFRDFMLIPELEGSTITIYDIKKEPLELVTNVCKVMREKTGKNFTIKSTMDIKKALQGADFVLTSYSASTWLADKQVMDICFKYGISHGIGDTVGPSGMIRAFKNVLAMNEITKHMEKICPKAYLVNFTNPMSTVTLSMLRHSRIKGVGLCHAIFGTVKHLSEVYKVPENQVEIYAAGVNHLTWVLDLYINSERKTDTLYKDIINHQLAKKEEDRRKGKAKGKVDWYKKEMLNERRSLEMQLFEKYGCLPIGGDTHNAEFFPFFYDPKTGHGKKYGIKHVDCVKRHKSKMDMQKLLQGWADGKEDPWDLDKFSGEDAHSVILSILLNKKEIHQVNYANNGCIDNLPKGAIIEGPGIFGAGGCKAVNTGSMPSNLASITNNLITIHELTVEAIMKRDKKLAIQALLLDPMIKDFSKVEKLLDELMTSQSKFLPKLY